MLTKLTVVHSALATAVGWGLTATSKLVSSRFFHGLLLVFFPTKRSSFVTSNYIVYNLLIDGNWSPSMLQATMNIGSENDCKTEWKHFNNTLHGCRFARPTSMANRFAR